MKRLGILLAVLAGLALGCAGLSGRNAARWASEPPIALEKVPALGDLFPLPGAKRYRTVASAQTYPYRDVRVGGVLYSVASNREGRVAYIDTNDPGFRTPEGLSIESTLEEVTATGAKPPWPEPGWAYHTELPSGWRAAFTVGSEMTSGPLQPGAKVAFFFQRD